VVRNLGSKASQKIADYVTKRDAFVYKGQAPEDDITKIDQGDVILKGLSDDEAKSLQDAINKSGYQGPKVKVGLDLYRIGKIFETDLGDEDGAVLLGNLLQNIKQNNKKLFNYARRDTKSMEDMVKLLEKKGLNDIVISLLGRNPDTDPLPLPDDTLAGIIGVIRLGAELDYANKLVMQTSDPDQKLIEYKKFARLAALQANLTANVSGAVSEYGRGLAVVRNIAKIREFNLKNYAQQITELVDDMDETTIDVLDYSPDEINLKMLQYTRLSKTGKAQVIKDKWYMTPLLNKGNEIYINALLTNPSTHTINVAGNLAFQALSLVERGVAGGVGAVRQGVNVLRGRYQGLDAIELEDRVNTDEFIHEAVGMFGSISDALVLGGRTLVKGESGDFASKIDLRNYKTIGKTSNIMEIKENLMNGDVLGSGIDMIGTAARFPGTMLSAEDEVFKVISRGRVRRREASRRASTAMRDVLRANGSKAEAMDAYKQIFTKIMHDPPDDVVEMMDLEAKAMTFQTDLKGFQGALSRNISHPILKSIFPFVKTPTNIINQVWDRTFAAPFSVARALKKGREGIKGSGREFDEAMAKLATGWTIFGGMFALTMGMYGDNVIVNGAGPPERAAKRRREDRGVQPYSISIKDEKGDYTTIPFSRLDPLSGILAISADMASVIKSMPDDQASSKAIMDMMMAGVLATAQYAGNLPFLQGTSELFQAIGSPFNNTAESFANLAEFFGKKAGDVAVNVGGSIEGRMSFGLVSLARQYVDLPYIGSTSFSAAMKRKLDPVMRTSRLPEERFEVLLGGKYYGMDYEDMFLPIKGFLDAVQRGKARSPYFSQDLEPSLDYWGNERTSIRSDRDFKFVPDIFESNSFFNPFKITDERYSTVDQEIERLSIAGAGTISFHNNKINGVEMTSKEYNKYIRLFNKVDSNGRLPGDRGYNSNKTVLPFLQDKIITDAKYLSLNDQERYEEIQTDIRNYSKHARDIIQNNSNIDIETGDLIGSPRLINLKNLAN
jgi:hypothetical protein